MASREVTEARLHSALERLLDRKPRRVKNNGKLSLNRINNEAGLGHSYIHKFEDFVRDIANPAIETFNKAYNPSQFELESENIPLTEVEKLKTKLKKEKELKEKYRKERDDAIARCKELEKHNSSLMFRAFELQDELRSHNVVSISQGGSKCKNDM